MENVLFVVSIVYGLAVLWVCYLTYKTGFPRLKKHKTTEVFNVDTMDKIQNSSLNMACTINSRYVKIGWVNDDFAKNQFTIYIKCDNIADYVYKWDMELNLPKTFDGGNVDIKELRKFLEIFKAIRDSMKM